MVYEFTRLFVFESAHSNTRGSPHYTNGKDNAMFHPGEHIVSLFGMIMGGFVFGLIVGAPHARL